MKKAVKIILTLTVLSVVLFFGATLTANAETTSDGFVYSVNDGEVTITGYTGSATELEIPSKIAGYSVTSIGFGAFECRSGLTSITIPDSVTSIDYGAFSDCENLQYNINKKGKYLGNADNPYLALVETELSAFTESFEFADGVKIICDHAFAKKTSLKNIVIPNSVLSIGAHAFDGCTALSNVTIGNSVATIGSYAFAHCSSIMSITIPDGVKMIGGDAFYNCRELTSITIGKGVSYIDDFAFQDCYSLKKVNISDLVSWCSIDFEGYYSNPMSFANELLLNGELIKEVVIPKDVTSINFNVFLNCNSLTSIVIADSVEKIGPNAFLNCTGLSNITIPNSVTSIDSSAFSNCSNLTDITIPDSVKSVGDYAFDNCDSLIHVWYEGSYDNRDEIELGTYNESLINATWHFNTCKNGAHSYDNNCDTDCNKCQWTRIIKHNYNKSVVASKYLKSAATCTAKAVYYKSCSCGAKGTATFESGDKLSHNYNQSVANTTYLKSAATCTSKAVYYKSCSCGAKGSATFQSGNKLAHNYNKSVVNSKYLKSAASCTSKAVYYKSCSCGAKGTATFQSGSKLAHDYETTTTKATLSKNGKTVKKCTVCGSKTTATIKYAKTFKLSTTSYTYNGKAKKPTVTVKDSAGKTISSKYYTVSYKNNTKVGKATVTIKFKGNYSGTKTLTFTIKPVKTTVSKLTAGKKSITVNITKKTTQVTGYQIQYSTSKKFTSAKTKTVSSYKTTKSTIKSLSAKKTYYVRVRTYKTVNGKKYYSGWSDYKKVKTK